MELEAVGVLRVVPFLYRHQAKAGETEGVKGMPSRIAARLASAFCLATSM